MAESVYLLLGSNIGNREKYLAAAREKLEYIEGLEIIELSPIYVTEPIDMEGENPPFLNQVVLAEYGYLPDELLRSVERIETGLGRTDKGQRRPRTIDIDILLFGDQLIDSPRLTVPHPGLLKRPFALIPLLDISPDLVHPQTGRPFREYVSDDDRKSAVLYKDYAGRNV
jgi:2-amino-4-hydroxy-6-hydroxymethyldihydropteridine diphosphokinase